MTAKPINAMLKVNLILDDDWISSMSMKMKEVFDSDVLCMISRERECGSPDAKDRGASVRCLLYVEPFSQFLVHVQQTFSPSRVSVLRVRRDT